MTFLIKKMNFLIKNPNFFKNHKKNQKYYLFYNNFLLFSIACVQRASLNLFFPSFFKKIQFLLEKTTFF